MTYNELVDAIRSFSEIDANVFTPTVVNNFILFAENRIMRDVDLDCYKEYDTATLYATSPRVTLPNGFLFARYVQVIPANGDSYYLEQRDVSFMNEYWPDESDTGTPKYYALWDQNTLMLAPSPNASVGSPIQVELGYFRRTPQLSSTNQTTWLSTNAPEALFYACMVEAMSYTKGPDNMLAYYNQRYADASQKLAVEQMGRGRRDEFRDGMLRFPLASKSP